MLSPIQIKILTKLLRSKGLRYSQARPLNTENDLYNYHLQFLRSKEYIEKRKDKYYLTTKGKKFVQQMDARGKIKELFKFSVLSYVIREVNGNKEILMQRHLRHPYYGDILSISGKVNPGEKIEDAAKRKLKEETGLDTDFTFIGVIRKIRKDKEGNLFEDTLYHVCYGEDPKGRLIEKNEFGENFWADFKKVFEMQRKNITASKKSEEILKRIQNKDLSLFYFTEKLILPKF